MILIISTIIMAFGIVMYHVGDSDTKEVATILIVLVSVFGFGLLGCVVPMEDGEFVTYDLVYKEKLDNGRTFFLILDHCVDEDDGWHFANFDEINCLRFTSQYNSYGWELENKKVEPGIKDENGNVRVKGGNNESR